MTTITLPRALIEQALEVINDTAYGAPVFRQEVRDTITTLRAALAQQAEPAQEPITRLFGTLPVHDTQQAEPLNLRDPAVQKRLATQWGYVPAAQAELVGWNWMLDGQPYGQAYYGNPPDTDIAERAATAGRTVRLLYTAPPRRTMVPLTEEEIMHIGMTHQSLRQVVRAVERAHGIKE